LAFNRSVVLRYRIHLEQKQYAPATINLRLAAVWRVAYEAADSGLLSPELAAGIRRVCETAQTAGGFWKMKKRAETPGRRKAKSAVAVCHDSLAVTQNVASNHNLTKPSLM
jgi:hypothetical protein